jgi:hypothetical protein
VSAELQQGRVLAAQPCIGVFRELKEFLTLGYEETKGFFIDLEMIENVPKD